MNSLKNNVQLIGRLGDNPEKTTFDSGKSVVSFSIAVNNSYKNKDSEKVEETNWFNIIMWGKTGELASEILAKGNEVVLTGMLKNRSYEKDGITKYVTEVVADEFYKTTAKESTDQAQ